MSNPTQITGLLVFLAAALACGWAARRTSGATANVWKALAVLQGLFVVEVLLGLRHLLHDAAYALLQQQGLYASRGPAQVALVAIAVGLAVLGLGLILKLRLGAGGPSVRVAALASFAVVALFTLEMISLHRIDAVLYQLVGPVMLVALMWAACSAAVVWAGTRAR